MNINDLNHLINLINLIDLCKSASFSPPMATRRKSGWPTRALRESRGDGRQRLERESPVATRTSHGGF